MTTYKEDEEPQIFRRWDVVWHWKYGKGKVWKARNCGHETFPVKVKFAHNSGPQSNKFETFTCDGRVVSSCRPTLSHRKYSLEKGGFKQLKNRK